jgi:hypothetical protein
VNQQTNEEFIERIIGQFDDYENLIISDAYPDGGTTMLFPRLERAALNQCDGGGATVSRYGIWANTARDHILEAISALEKNDVREVRRLLVGTHNSLSAFCEIQKYCDPHEV